MSNENLQKAVEDSETQNCHVIHYSFVDKIHNKGGKDKRILIITNVFIAFYKVKRVPTRDRTMYWPFLTNITTIDNSLTIEFGDEKLQFETKDVDLVLKIIISIIQRILPKSFIKTLNIPQNFINPEIVPNSLGVLAKFLGCYYKTGHQKLNNSFTLLRNFLSYHDCIFNFSSTELNQYIQPLIQSISNVPFCESLILPKFDKSATGKLFNSLGEIPLPYLRHILIRGQIPEDFQFLINKVCQQTDSKLTGISFVDCSLTEAYLAHIQQLMISKEMKSLSLQNSLLTTKLSYLYKSFFIPDLSDNLMMLNLDRTIKLDLIQLFECVPKLYSLSLANCELDIITVFQSLHTKPLENLMLLNLSNNRCSSSFDTIEFPKNLSRLDINHITFDSTLLPRFFSALVNNKWSHGMNLSISKIKTDNWSKLFQCMRDLKSSTLTGLTWIGNDIDNDSFYHFLKQCKCLEHLDMSKSFTSQSYDAIHKFSEVLPQLPLLKTLILIGGEKNQMKSSIEPILLALEKSPMLRVLDIRNNLIDNNIFGYILNLIQNNSSIHTINVDGSSITNLDPYYDLIKICSTRNIPFYVSYPSSDVDRLLESELIDKKEKLGLITSFQKMTYFSKSLIDAGKNSTCFEEPFEVYKMHNKLHSFPLYIDDALYNLFAYSNVFEEINSYFKGLSHDFSDRFSPSKFEVTTPPSNESVLSIPIDKLRQVGQTTPQLKLKNIIDLRSPKLNKFGNGTDDLSDDDDFDSVYKTTPDDLNSSQIANKEAETPKSGFIRKPSLHGDIQSNLAASSGVDIFKESDSDVDLLPKSPSTQIAKPIMHLPSQDELERMQDDLDNDDYIFTGEFAQPQPVKAESEPEKISLEQFKDDDDDDDIAGSNDSFFGPSVRKSFEGLNELSTKLKIDLYHSQMPKTDSPESEKQMEKKDSTVINQNEQIDKLNVIDKLQTLDDSNNEKTINSEYDDSHISFNSDDRIKSYPLIYNPKTPNKDKLLQVLSPSKDLLVPIDNNESSSAIEFVSTDNSEENENKMSLNEKDKIEKDDSKIENNLIKNEKVDDTNETVHDANSNNAVQETNSNEKIDDVNSNEKVHDLHDVKEHDTNSNEKVGMTTDHQTDDINPKDDINQIDDVTKDDSTFIEEEEYDTSDGDNELYSRQFEEAKVLATAERLKQKCETSPYQTNSGQISFVGTNDSAQAISNELYTFDGSKTRFEWESDSDKNQANEKPDLKHSNENEKAFETPNEATKSNEVINVLDKNTNSPNQEELNKQSSDKHELNEQSPHKQELNEKSLDKHELSVENRNDDDIDKKVSKIPKRNRTKEDEELLQKKYGRSENDSKDKKLVIQNHTPETKHSMIPISDRRIGQSNSAKKKSQGEEIKSEKKSDTELKHPKFTTKRPDWDNFPLKPLSKPKDRPRVEKFDKKYSLQKLLYQVDEC